MLLCVVLAYRNGHPIGEAVPLRDALQIAFEAVWGLVTLVIILGGILGGVFTAIEAGAVACVYAFIVTMFIYRDYRWRDLPLLVYRTLRTVSMVMMLIACAASVGYMMALMQMPAKITIRLKDGTTFSHVVQDYPGMPSHPFTWDDVVAKFDQLVAGRIDTDLATQIKDAVRSVENIQVKDLMALLARVRAD